MSYNDDINRRLKQLKEILDIPEEKVEGVKKVLRGAWEDARSYDRGWDSD